MRPLSYQSSSSVSIQARRSIRMIGQPIGGWQHYQMWAPTKLSCTVTISSILTPRTGVHTQEVESAWSQLKLGQKKRKGLRREDVQSYLDERMWRQWRGGQLNVIMRNFLYILTLQFLVNTPVLWGQFQAREKAEKCSSERFNSTYIQRFQKGRDSTKNQFINYKNRKEKRNFEGKINRRFALLLLKVI